MTNRTIRALCATLAALFIALTLTACQSGGTTEETTADDATNPPSVTDTAPLESVTEAATEAVTEAPDLSLWLVKDGASNFVIQGDDAVAMYTLSDAIAAATGVTLTVVADDVEVEADGLFKLVNAEDVGNYGYRITVGDAKVTISAASTAGYDKAIARLMADAATEGGLKLAPDYAAEEILDWASDYVLDADDYNAAYRDDLFYNDKNDGVAYVSNAMWHMFGLIDDGQSLVYRFGNEPTWYEWMSEKVAWSGDTAYINELKGKLQSFPQTSTGYMWSWGTYPYWKVDNCYSIHYDGTFRYISAVYDVVSWEGSTDFLSVVDNSAAGGTYASVDASRGRTVMEKTEACMSYILDYLHGRDGYIQLTEASTYLNADGSERFDYVADTDSYCWNNTGKPGSTASNYWDNLCFGNYDAYENALFYQALNSMAGIYRMVGGAEAIAKAEELEALAVTVKERFNELYWSEEAGRYIACIDTDGNRVDYGLTFLNFEIMKYGLADEEKAALIFAWIDGDRTVDTDTRTGADILSYAEVLRKCGRRTYETVKELNLRLAAVSNTVAINNDENKKLGIAWWHGPAGINVWGSAAYGYHLENGGYIFYPVFYELMARTDYEGAQATTDRLMEIAKVYEYNRLVSDLAAGGSANWLEGLNGEFPESGLVPTAYLYSLLGIEASYDGLYVAPAFNDVYEYMGTKKLTYGGHSYGVEVNRNGSCTITATDGVLDLDLHYTPARFASHSFTVRLTNAEGDVTETTVTPDENGVLHLSWDTFSVASVEITPVLS